MNINLNQEQKQAVTHKNGPLLIVAGAGTGKTSVITERIAWLIEQKLASADEILALTFTDKAAGEMEERVDKILPYGYVDLWVMTFHSFCDRILKNHALDIGIPNDYKLLSQTEQWMLVRQNLDKFNLDYYRPLGNPTKFIHALIRHFSRCKDEEILPGDYLKYAEDLKINLDSMESTGGAGKKRIQDTRKQTKLESQIPNHKQEVDVSEIKRLEEISNAYHVYQQLLLDNNSLDFGDLINYCLKLFKTRPHILKKYQSQFKYVLVDEFQDTNWAQYELVKLLAGSRQNLTVVGDDDQSIFAFRGASMSNILQFKNDYPKTKEVFLVNNYRSVQNILDFAYSFVQLNNPERLEVRLREKGNKNLSKKLKSQIAGEGVIEHIHVASESDEARMVVGKILELYNTSESPRALGDSDGAEQLSWNDFVILVRANNQAEPFLNALAEADVPYNFVASKGLYTKEVVMDILAYLKLLDNYHESLALWRVLNLPMIKIKPEDLMELTKFANRKAYSLYEACQQINLLGNVTDDTRKKVAYLLNLMSKHTSLAKTKSVKKVVLQFLEDFNYSKYLLEHDENKVFAFINHLGKKMDEFEKAFDDKSVKNFIRLIELELESGEQGSLSKELQEGPEAVKVMTIHAAKGLEFKYVFVVNMVDKRFPSMERSEAIELPDALVKEAIPEGDVHLQEERRLFYVAATRAKLGLFLTSADDYGGTRKKKLSRFIYESGLEDKQQDTRIQTNSKFQISNFKQKAKSPIINYQSLIPTTFSFSQLKAFETCPYQYYLNFILKIPTAGKASFSFGKTMHSTLQKFFSLIKTGNEIEQGNLFSQNNQLSNAHSQIPSLNQLLKFYQESWVDDWYEDKKQKEEYRKQGDKSLHELYKKLEDEGLPQVVELERGFNFKLDKYTIKGTIDRVDKLPNGKVEIIDYKTGSPKDEKTLEKDQLLIYQMAAQETFGWEIEKMTYHYLNNNSTQSFLGSEKEIEKFKTKMLELIEKIISTDFSATPSSFTCQYCDYKGICSYRAQ